MQKLLFVHHFGGIGGAGKSMINNISLLNEKFDIHVIVPSSPSDIGSLLEGIEGVSIIYVDFIPSIPIYSGGLSLLSLRLYIHLFKSIRYKNKFINLINDLKPDVVVANSIILCWLSRFLNCKSKICFVRETKNNSLANIPQRKLLNLFDKVVFLSQYDLKSWDLSTDVRVIENSVEYNQELIKDSAVLTESDYIKVLFLGGTSYIKGFFFLMTALLFVKQRKNIMLIVLGDINKKIKYIYGLLFKDRIDIEFIGKVTNVSKYYQSSDLVIFPVVKVHQGRPIFEAGYHSKFVIAPNFPNLNEYVIDGFNGIIYDRYSPISLSRVFDMLIEGKYDKESLAKNNFKMYMNKHTKQRAKDNVFDLFNIK